ncbi:hypothetical protein MTR67_051788 [Solanum verrucosum]|uniref:Uncharacterized protein n=1 Tax=Solanum verrucosum TaxID=315347 RepID=A0AAF0V3Y7_SOLVR|nr:hypothetical protein MTR67_051788 [Solanum verrucosum]
MIHGNLKSMRRIILPMILNKRQWYLP